MRRARLITCGAVLMACLTGCVNDGYAIFDRESTPEDALPADFDEFDTSEYDLDSVRFAASDEDTDLYLLQATGGVCLAVTAGRDSVIACGGPPVGTSLRNGNSYRFGPSPISVPEGWTRLTDNIAAKDR